MTIDRGWISRAHLRGTPGKRRYIALHCDHACQQSIRIEHGEGVLDVPQQFWRDIPPCAVCQSFHPEWTWYANETPTPGFYEWWRAALRAPP